MVAILSRAVIPGGARNLCSVFGSGDAAEESEAFGDDADLALIL
jgi:hypothetical protein